MRSILRVPAMLVAAVLTLAFGPGLAQAQKALVYCPTDEAASCSTVAAALTAGGFSGVDKGYDGTNGTVDLKTVDLFQYSVVFVPSLSDDATYQPYAMLRDPAVQQRLAAATLGRRAFYSGTPDLGTTNRASKDALISSLARWAAASYAAVKAPGLVALQDQSDDQTTQYKWSLGITGVQMVTDPKPASYDSVRTMSAAGLAILSSGGTQLKYANMASFGFYFPSGGAGLSMDAVGQTGTTVGGTVVLVTSEGANTGGAVVKTDKDDYSPGTTVVMTGTGFGANETVSLVLHEDPLVDNDRTFTTTADANGSFTFTGFAPEPHDIGVRFILTALGKASGRRAQTTFTDGVTAATVPTVTGTASSAGASCATGSTSPYDVDTSVCVETKITTSSGNNDNGQNDVQFVWYRPDGNVAFWSTAVTVAKNATAFSVTDRRTLSIGGAWQVKVCQAVADANPKCATILGTGNGGNFVPAVATINIKSTATTGLAVSSATGTFGGATALTATLTSGSPAVGVSGKPINFSLNGTNVGSATTNASGVATLSNVSLSGINAGTYNGAVAASFVADANYAASNGSGNLVVDKAAGSITISNLPSTAVFGGSFSPTFTALGDGTPSVTSLTTSVCTVSAGVVSYATAGQCQLQAAITVGTNYTAATGSTQSFTIGKATNVITFAALANKAFGDAALTLSATASSGLAVSFALDAASQGCTLAGTTLTITGATAPSQSCVIVASQAGNTNFEAAANVPRSFTIAKATPTVTAVGGSFPYDGTPKVGSGTASGVGEAPLTPVTLSYAGTGTTTYAASATAPTSVGTYTVAASYPGDANYNSATSSAVPLTITKANQTITFAALGGKSFGDADFTVSATASSTLAVSFMATGACTVTGSTVHITSAGTCTIAADQVGDGNYNAAPQVSQSFTIAKASSTTLITVSGATYDGAPHGGTALATGAGGLSQNLTASISYVGRNGTTYAASTTAPTGAGDYTASVSYAGDANHDGSNDSKDFSIAKATSSVGLSCPTATQTYTGSPITPCTAQATGAGLTAVAVTPSYASNTNVGTAAVTADYAGDANHLAAPQATGSFTIGKATSTTAVSCPAGPYTYTGAAQTPCTVVVTGAGGLSTTPTATYTNNVNAGTATASYTFAGDANHDGSTDSKTFVIGKATQAITFAQPATPAAFNTTFAVGPTSNSALAVSVAASGSCSISGGTVTITSGTGDCTLTATQAGNDNVSAADPVVRTVAAAKATATLTLAAADLSQTYNGSAKAVGYTTSPANLTTVSISYSQGGNAATPTNAGSYGVTATLANANYELAAPVTGTLVIAKAPSSVSFTSTAPATLAYGATYTPAATATGDGALTIGATGACSISGGIVTISAGSGTCTVTATTVDGQNYLGASAAPQSISATKAAATIALSNLSYTYDGTAKAATPTTSPAGLSGVSVVYKQGTTTVAAADVKNAGSYTVEATLSNANYALAAANDPTTGTLVIAKAANSITWTQSLSGAFGDAPITLTATATTGTVSYAAAGACSIDANGKLALDGAGSCTVTAKQAGNDNYVAAADVPKTFTIAKADQTISFGALGAKTFGDADFTVAATTSSALTVAFTATGDCSVTGTTVHITGAGSCTIKADQAGNGNYNAAPQVPQSFTVAKAGSATTVTVSNATYDGNPHGGTATVTGTGGLTASATIYYVGRAGTTYASSTTAPTNAGDYTASATYAATANYLTSTDSKDFTIARVPVTATAGSGSATYTGSAQSPAACAVTGTYTTGITCANSPASVGPDAGTTTITPSIGGTAASNFDVTPVNGSYTIGKATSTTAVSCPAGPYTYTGAAQTPCTVAVTGAGGLSTTPTATYTNNVNAGTATASYTFAGDANHDGSTDSKTFTIGKASSATTVSCTTGPFTYNGTAQTPCSAAATGVGLSTPVAVTPVTYTDNTNAGTAGASATWTGDDNHVGSTGTASFVIGKASPAVTATGFSGSYDGLPHGGSGAATGVGAANLTPVTLSYQKGGVDFSGTPTSAGTYTVVATFAGNGNYDAKSSTAATIQIDKATPTVNVSWTGGTFGASNAATGSVTGVGTPAEALGTPTFIYEGVSPTVYAASSTAPTNAGSYKVTASFAGNYNYSQGSSSTTTSIAKATSTTAITVSGATYDGSAHGGTAVATGAGNLSQALTASISYTGRNTTTYAASTTPPTGAGDYTASVNFAGDDNHTGSSDTKDFSIAKATSSVGLSCPTTAQTYTGAPITPCTAQATGAGLTAVAVTPSYASNTNVGTAAVTADYAGDANHLAAPQATGSFTIGKATSTTAVSCPAGPYTYTGAAQTPCTVAVTGAGTLSLTPAPTYTNNVNAGTATASYTFAGDANHDGSTDSKTFEITKKIASVTPAAAQTKVYGGTEPTLTGATSGFLAADNVAASYTRAAGETVGKYKITATLTPAAALTNYDITYNTADFEITKKAASVVVNAASKVYGGTDLTLGGTVTGFLAADNVTVTYSRAAGETVAGGPYAITAVLSAAAGVLANYDVTNTPANFTITPKAASVTPAAASKTYGGTEPTLGGALSGFLAADAVTATYSRTSGETVAGSPYTISATLAPAAKLSNYNITYNTAQFTITPAVATVVLSDLVQPLNNIQAPTATTSPLNLTVKFTYMVNGSPTTTRPAAVGVYAVKAEITNSNYAATPADGYFVIYDPSGGFVTGGGWITAASGSCLGSSTLPGVCTGATGGRANFGFVSKYQNGAKVPTGSTEFQFQAGNLNFKSSVYQWLTVAGAMAQFKGQGTINGGIAQYNFLVTAIDGSISGGLGVDKFRIKITIRNADGTDGGTIFDNQLGADDTAGQGSPVEGGSISIKTK